VREAWILLRSVYIAVRWQEFTLLIVDQQIYGSDLADHTPSLVMVYDVIVDLLEDGSNLEGNTLTLYTPLPAPLDAHRLQKMLNAVMRSR
jgi:hypothetical protein